MILLIDFEKFNSKSPKIKYGLCKELVRIAQETPVLLYPHFDKIASYLNHDNQIIKWTAIDLIGYISSVDREEKVINVLKPLTKLLHSGHLITCNHAIKALGIIAENIPALRKKIIQEYLKIQNDTFETEECFNIAVGKVILSLIPLVDNIKKDKKIISFLNDACDNSRIATQKKARQLLQLIEKSI